MDVLVALGVAAPFAASLWATLTDGPEVYFDSVTMFVFFLFGGRYLEMIARQKAVRGVEELGKALPSFCGASRRLAGESAGERARLRSWWRGRCCGSVGEVIRSMAWSSRGAARPTSPLLTGESMPAPKGGRRSCTGGSINVSPRPAGARGAGGRRDPAGGDPSPDGRRRPRNRASPRTAHFIVTLLVLAAGRVAWYLIDPSRSVLRLGARGRLSLRVVATTRPRLPDTLAHGRAGDART